MASKLLPVEGVLRGSVQGPACRKLNREYELFFISSEEEWQAILKDTLRGHNVADEYLDELKGQTNFQTQRLLLALRTCESNIRQGITIDRVISVDDHLYVYVQLTDAVPNAYIRPDVEGHFYLVRIPWSQDNSNNPTLEGIGHHVFVILGEPVP